MKNAVYLAVFLSLLSSLTSFAAEIRTWTSGKYKTEAEFVKLSEDGQTVTLRKTDGKESSLPLKKLSKEDQDYVKSVQGKVVAGNVNRS